MMQVSISGCTPSIRIMNLRCSSIWVRQLEPFYFIIIFPPKWIEMNHFTIQHFPNRFIVNTLDHMMEVWLTFCQTPKGMTLMLVSFTWLCFKYLSQQKNKLTLYRIYFLCNLWGRLSSMSLLTKTQAWMCHQHIWGHRAFFLPRPSVWDSYEANNTSARHCVNMNSIQG